MIAIIDIGSNTTTLAVYQTQNTDFTPVFNKKYTLGLAGYINDHKLSNEGIKVAIETLKDYREVLKDLDIREVYALATAPFRNITNDKEALLQIEEATKIKIKALSGDEEATYDFKGAMINCPIDEGLMIHIGGGSTELVAFKNKKIIRKISLPIGSLNTYRQYFGHLNPSKEEIKTCERALETIFDEALKDWVEPIDDLVGVGGTIRSLFKLCLKSHDLTHERALGEDIIKEEIIRLKESARDSYDLIIQICPERIHTLLPGAMILESALKRFNSHKLILSPYGVKEGFLQEHLQVRG